MTDLDPLCQELQDLWHHDFPLSKAMDMHVANFAGHVITTHTSLKPNTNTHGTAFAGSLYAIEALTAWGLLYLELAHAGLDGSIIHASGNIEFAKPVTEDIVATASFTAHGNAMDELRQTGKLRLQLVTEVIVEDAIASRFEGLYVVRLNSRE